MAVFESFEEVHEVALDQARTAALKLKDVVYTQQADGWIQRSK